jgi:GNAT superfamily N-acetyltransferase
MLTLECFVGMVLFDRILVFSSLLLIRSLVSVLVILHFVMPTAKENRDGRNSLIKRALFILVLLSLVVLLVYYVHSKSKQTPPVTNLLGKFSSDITVRPAIPADYAYYLEIYPDLEIDQPPVDEAMWSRRDLPGVTIITQGAQSVGYIWAIKYDQIYYLEYFVVGREHRRKGIGTKALRHLKAHAKQLGYGKWRLDCDPNHHIPYKMYIKAGMSKVGDMYHVKVPYSSSLTRETNMNVMIVYDPEQWPILEDKYGLIKGRIQFLFPCGILPVLLIDSNGQARGFVIFSPTDFKLLNLVVDSSEDLMSFLSLLQDLKAPDANPEWVHFWIDTGKKYSEIALSSVPGAIASEQYDILEGSTSE